jgi:hypothetical protein
VSSWQWALIMAQNAATCLPVIVPAMVKLVMKMHSIFN